MSTSSQSKATSTTAVLALAAALTALVSNALPIGDRDVAAVEVIGMPLPAPSQLVWLESGAGQASDTLTVPDGKVLVITGLTSTNEPVGYCTLIIDGVNRSVRMGERWENVSSGGRAMTAVRNHTMTLDSGIILQAGRTVQLAASADWDWMFGYFADA